ncbi:hypothetical protein TNIN_45391 [Trichonephila inaurata madagascariensis]|uniref:Uncharacterized protein n=1 Tax=Trichonephila inaurata madagascariensis TaxID=2747483 RepID=A0A8X6MIF4_9ARAC|nr:hypothetical protein TNIN_45391 [Trichonephila inaurata madagascariensis]
MNSLALNIDAASSVTLTNHGCARGLERGPRLSPQVLKILHCNNNDLSTLATRTELDQLLGKADLSKVQVIAIHEIILKKTTALKIRGYNILRAKRST